MNNEPKTSYVCRKKFTHIYQFKIGLKDTRPPVWRRIQVPEVYSFWDFHVAIQDAMGWQDCHLHEWLLKDQDTGDVAYLGIWPAEFEDEPEVIMDWEVYIKILSKSPELSLDYKYDFGDGWQHIIFFEGRFPRNPDKKYPCCIEGQRACPPEDVGGPWGYQDFLKAMEDKDHPRHVELIHWCGKVFDPDIFSPENVKFWNPQKRLKMAFQE